MDPSPRQSSGDEDDGYFNDLTQNPKSNGDQPPKAKRIACVLCRKRKLRCDGVRPSCGTCSRLSHDCSYDEVRKKSGPKRGYVKQLENRLAQVEELLKSNKDDTGPYDMDNVTFSGLKSNSHVTHNVIPPMPNIRPANEMVAMGMEESLPPQDTIDDLNRLYFEKVHPVASMIHPGRFHAAMTLAPKARPRLCLRYAMWATVASVVDKYADLQEHFYKRARKYVELDEMTGHGEDMISVQHVQTWYLLGILEFKMTFFPRAWMSTGRACRLALMMGLHRVDGAGMDVKQCLPSPRDWVEKEERRRTFWQCFSSDRFASIGTGWPMVIDERDIHTVLPVDEEAFQNSRETLSITLDKALEPGGATGISSAGGVAVMAAMFGRNLVHLHRGTPDDNERSLNGKFWLRHRSLDTTLLNIALSLPDHLRMPSGINDQNAIFTNLCIHTSTICLHQAAIFKADTHKLPSNVSAECKIRCITAAAEIASVMRMISHTDMTTVSRDRNRAKIAKLTFLQANPFSSFCLYVAARVFVQYLKSRPTDNNVKSSLHFLLTAMQALRRKNLLTESLLIQLDIDLQGAGLEESRSLRNRLAKMNDDCKAPMNKCPTDPDNIHTFGDNGLSKHTDPRFHGQPQSQASSRVQSFSDASSRAARSTTEMSDGRRFQQMPMRNKTPSTRPSPATVSDDLMEYLFDGSDEMSPGSFAGQSSHTSNFSQTPPISTAQKDFDPNAMAFDGAAMTNEEFQAMMDGIAPETLLQSPNDQLQTLFGSGPDDANFTMPNMNNNLNMGQQQHSGWSPMNNGDSFGTNSDDLLHYLDPSTVDMGWSNGIPTHSQTEPMSQQKQWARYRS